VLHQWLWAPCSALFSHFVSLRKSNKIAVWKMDINKKLRYQMLHTNPYC